jgi:hypothetical protein
MLMWAKLLIILHIGLLQQMIPQKSAEEFENRGYWDITVCEDHFIAVGRDGRIDLISTSGEIRKLLSPTNQDLKSVHCNGGIILVAGDKGTLLITGARHVFTKIETHTEENLNGVTTFKDNIIAAADHGILLISRQDDPWEEIHLPLRGDIVSISAGSSLCFGVTNKGEIISSSNAIDWIVFDYNSVYKGYGKPCIFNEVLVTNKWISIVGRHEDNTPVALFSSQGNVWMERSLNYSDNDGRPQVFVSIPNAIEYDPVEDQFFIACDSGDVSVLSSCNKCNKSYTLTDKNIRGIAHADNMMMFVGDEWFVDFFPLRSKN